MNSFVAAVVQGIVEGLTEFLPVSSTAHIVIAQEWMKLDRADEFWKMFAVVIQLGAILAVVAYFWKRLTAFALSFPNGPVASDETTAKRVWWRHPLALVAISFVTTAIPCLIIDKMFEKLFGDNLESFYVIGSALLIGGIAMYAIDRWFDGKATTTTVDSMTLGQAITIGFAQILAAAFPGTSRSMVTIAGGQIMGLSRSTALEFSFFLSIPVMFAAAGYKLFQFIVKEPVAMTTDRWTTLAIGFVTSFIVAIGVIAWFTGWVRKHGFTPFAIYRVIVGAALIAWEFYLRKG